MQKKLMIYLFLTIVLAGSIKGLVLNTLDIAKLNLPSYHLNPFFLSGSLMLFDRPMFFENRSIKIKFSASTQFEERPYLIETKGYNSYIQRRLFRMSANEHNCGINQKAALEYIFCENRAAALQDLKVDELFISFDSVIGQKTNKTFHHKCGPRE